MDNDIVPSTFYSWIRKLQNHACYEVPGNSYFHNGSPVATTKQDIVCINILQEEHAPAHPTPIAMRPESAPIMLQYKDAKISVSDDFNEVTLKRVLMILREALC